MQSRRIRWLVGAVTAAAFSAAAAADSTDTVPGPKGSVRGDGPGGVLPADLGAGKRAAAPARRVSLPPLDPSRLLAEDALALRDLPGPKARRIGLVRGFRPLRAPRELRPDLRGVARLADGGLAWTMEIASPGAVGVRVHFAHCVLPPGATVVVYDADEPTEAYGPWTGAGPHDTAEFWSPTVFGDRVRVELRVTADAVGAPLLLVADAIAHDYAQPAPVAPPGVTGNPKSAGYCENDVQCDAAFAADAAHAVARIEFVSGGTTYDCSGSLLNDKDPTTNTPWFLTANHCISAEPEANSIQFYWDYYAPTCGGAAPSLQSVPRSSGATLVVTSSQSDVTLVRITGTVPSGRAFLGWSSVSPGVGTAIYGVHHPAGDVMKISYGSITAEQQNFHDVVWTSGVTEGGSSGSPLLNANQQVLGQLWGGSSYCSQQSGVDSYGRFDVSYPLLKPYINDITGTTPPPPGGPPPGGPPGPGPVGDPPEFPLGLWEGANLGHGAYYSWKVDVLRPTYPPNRTLKLKVQVRGRPGAWVKLTDPLGHVSIHPRGKSFVTTIYQGYWPLELHSAANDAPKFLKVRLSKNW
jgi:hypothetical protein